MNVPTKVALVLVAQLALTGVAVAPQISARATGDDYLFRVTQYDPVDPARGAYVALAYPDLTPAGTEEPGDGTVFLTLVEKDGVWVLGERTPTRPDAGPYLSCDDRGYQLRCGMESYFLPQDKAAEFDRLMAGGQAVARVRIDGRGHAALISVHAR